MPIDLQIDRSKDLATLTLAGEVTLAEMVDALNAYAKSGVAGNELYDVRQLAGERISAADIDAISNYFKRYGSVRPANSKTAVLVADTLDFGISRMIQMLTDGAVPFKIGVFRSLEEALAWIESKPS
jgi:hypothetical protein